MCTWLLCFIALACSQLASLLVVSSLATVVPLMLSQRCADTFAPLSGVNRPLYLSNRAVTNNYFHYWVIFWLFSQLIDVATLLSTHRGQCSMIQCEVTLPLVKNQAPEYCYLSTFLVYSLYNHNKCYHVLFSMWYLDRGKKRLSMRQVHNKHTTQETHFCNNKNTGTN